MPRQFLSGPLVRPLSLALAVIVPAFAVRGMTLPAVVQLLVFGAAVVGASFLLAWAAEAAQKDISGPLAIALLALIAVLPEYAVDLYYAYQSGSDLEYAQFALANMTGSNRLLLGLGWPLVVLAAVFMVRGTSTKTSLALPEHSRLDIGFLALVAVVVLAIPVMGEISFWFGLGLIFLFGLYLWRAGRSAGGDEDEPLVGVAGLLANLSTSVRRTTVVLLFIGSATVILLVAKPFAEALVASGDVLGVDSYFLVQWLAPLASEAPEFIIALIFAWRGLGAAAIGTLIAAKINQWSLLVGSIPVAHLLGGGEFTFVLDARQTEEFVLTATQTLLGVSLLLSLRFHWATAVSLTALFALQFAVTDTAGRYLLSGVHVVIAVGFLIVNRRHLVSTLLAPWRRAGAQQQQAIPVAISSR